MRRVNEAASTSGTEMAKSRSTSPLGCTIRQVADHLTHTLTKKFRTANPPCPRWPGDEDIKIPEGKRLVVYVAWRLVDEDPQDDKAPKTKKT